MSCENGQFNPLVHLPITKNRQAGVSVRAVLHAVQALRIQTVPDKTNTSKLLISRQGPGEYEHGIT
jgi:hypothetical protein